MPLTIRHSAAILAVSSFALSFNFAHANPPHDDHAEQGGHENHNDDNDHDEHGDHEYKTLDTVIVSTTRSGRAVNDEPVRVEVIGREEIEEKAIMRPGNISMLVAETGGVRVQTTSPALGASNIRLQGLYGRYTQLLSDGLPLYGGKLLLLGFSKSRRQICLRLKSSKGLLHHFMVGQRSAVLSTLCPVVRETKQQGKCC